MFALAADAEAFDAFLLNLADTLAGEAELHGYLVEAEGMRQADAEVHLDDLALVLGESGECAFDFEGERLLHECAVGGRCVLVGQHVDEVDVLVGHEGRIDGDVATRDAEDALDLVLRDVEEVGEFLFRWRTFEFLLKAADFLLEFIEGAELVGGQTDDAGVLGDGLENGLTNPPHSVGDELEAAGFVEALGGLDEADVTLVNQVGEAETLVLVLLGHRDHETEVGLGEAVEGLLVAVLDALGKLHFLFRGEQFLAADVLQILVERLDVTIGNRMGNL